VTIIEAKGSAGKQLRRELQFVLFPATTHPA